MWLAVAAVSVTAVVALVLKPRPKAGPVRIAGILPLTGPDAAIGLGMRNALRLAFNEVNARGGIQGRKVELVEVDDRSDPATAPAAAAALAADKTVLAAIGHYNPDTDYAMQPALGAGRVPDVVVGVPVRESSTLGRNDAEFSLLPLGGTQMAHAAKYAWETLGARRFSFIRDRSDLGLAMVNEFRASLTPYFKHVVSGDELVRATDRDFAPAIASIRKTDPQFVFFGGDPVAAARFLVQLRDAGVTAPFQCASQFPSQEFIDTAGAGAEGSLAVFAGVPAEAFPAGRAFLDAYAKMQLAEPPSMYGIYAYAGAQALLGAASRSFLTRPSIAGALTNEELETALGPIRFVYGGSTYRTVALYQVKSGRWTPIYQSDSAGKLVPYAPR